MTHENSEGPEITDDRLVFIDIAHPNEALEINSTLVFYHRRLQSFFLSMELLASLKKSNGRRWRPTNDSYVNNRLCKLE
jgi:hypothetical protein